MIVTPFSNKILVKDHDFPDLWTEELIVTLKYLAANKEENCSLTKAIRESNLYSDTHKTTKPYIIHEETATRFEIISELRKIFIDGFVELNKAYGNPFTEEYLRKVYLRDSGNFATVKTGSYVGIHDHPSIAFAIFYLSDVVEEDGGQLILHDPSFNNVDHFSCAKEIKIKAKKNRLVIGPASIWHEVELYTGHTDRLCAVIDLRR
jgi:hypothetical protein